MLLMLYPTGIKANGWYPPDSTAAPVISDTVATDTSRFIKNLEFSLDYGKLATLPFKFEKKAQAGAGIYFRNNFGLAVEAGYGKLIPETAYRNADYQVEGIYGLAGFNYMYEYNPGTRLYLGARYAMSRFSDRADFTILNPLWEDYNGSFERSGLSAKWAELIFGSESSWKRNLFLGFTVRFRIMISYPQFNDVDLYAVPGYGRAADKTTPAFNLYLKYLFLHPMPKAPQ